MNKTQEQANHNSWKSKIKKYIVPVTLLVILTVIVSWIAYQRVLIQINIGPGWDTYAFLANAMEFAGKGFGYAEFERPPLMSVVTSLIFYLGIVNERAIYYVDSLFYIIGVLGLYLFLKLRFSAIESFLGALLFATFPVVLLWLGTGYSDIASISLSILSLYFLSLAVIKDSRFFYLTFLLAMLSFLTRFTSAFIIFPMTLYILISGNYLKNIKKIGLGIFISILAIIPYLYINLMIFGSPFFPFTVFLQLTDVSSAQENFAYTTDKLFFIYNLDSYISLQGTWESIIFFIIILFIILGFLFYLYNIFSTKLLKEKVKNKVYKLLGFERSQNKFKFSLTVIFGILWILGFISLSYMYVEILFFIFCIVSYFYLKDISDRDLRLDFLFFSWFMSFFIFHSIYGVKVERYFITMTPPLTYFIILGVNQVSNKFKIQYKRINISPYIIISIFIFLLLISSNVYLNSLPDKTDYLVADSISAAEWMQNNVSNYKDMEIMSDLWPVLSWYLKMDVKPMPFFKNSLAFNHELQKQNADFYLTIRDVNLPSYKKVIKLGSITIYKKNPAKFQNKPRALYIGKNWQNYIEDVLNFRIYLIHELLSAGRLGTGKSIYLDNYSPQELDKYPYIFIYNFKWHNLKNTENLIFNYVKNGGTVVIDASSNLDGIYYNLDNTIFLDTIISKGTLSSNPNIDISPNLTQEVLSISPFISNGGDWNGANYESIGDNKIEPLMTANGKTIIGIQRIGKGKIIWIGYNFVWHAFFYNNSNEELLIQKSIFGS
ncbi:MAG: glycosyltransferase family 39 protein [Methanobacteriaceae archaeon]|nr:glycosyltransferase family 39 protein [Methanobacteriaceae archaeon]